MSTEIDIEMARKLDEARERETAGARAAVYGTTENEMAADARRLPEVLAAVANMRDAIDGIASRVEGLEPALAGVLGPADHPLPSVADEAVNAPLAREIHEQATRLRGVTVRLDDVIRRLEI